MAGEVEGTGDRGAESAAAGEDVLGRIGAGQLAEVVASFARENPHVALAAAAGLGFLLGGGLNPRMLGTLGVLATKGYLRGTLNQALHDVLGEPPHVRRSTR